MKRRFLLYVIFIGAFRTSGRTYRRFQPANRSLSSIWLHPVQLAADSSIVSSAHSADSYSAGLGLDIRFVDKCSAVCKDSDSLVDRGSGS